MNYIFSKVGLIWVSNSNDNRLQPVATLASAIKEIFRGGNSM